MQAHTSATPSVESIQPAIQLAGTSRLHRARGPWTRGYRAKWAAFAARAQWVDHTNDGCDAATAGHALQILVETLAERHGGRGVALIDDAG